ncbi:MAG: type II toxin-antitoxin system Phd/YefM family antitoxin [Deltaproteobacteria bacterium]|nr:type II toxin-antitoxin system Phd/YefM family antitoxin [Deltaproteobacteria bacterium]
MGNMVSKSRFKPNALKYFRQIEDTGKELIITDHGKPKLKIIPYNSDPMEILNSLRNTVIEYIDPLEPVLEEDWEALK